MKKISVLLLSVLLLLGLSLSALARELPDPARPGSLTLSVDWEGEPLDSGSLTLCRVGQVATQEGDDTFVLIPELKDSDVFLKHLDNVDLPGQLASLAAQRKLETVSAPIEKGEAYFENLLPGLYLVTQQEADACEGFAPIAPFLVSLPHWNGSTYVYDVSAQPKVSLEALPTQPTQPSQPTEPTDPKLPQTGQLSWPVPVMAVAGLAFLTGGLLLCFGKKEHHES